jgi:cyclopropane-fatty-acyl-phospholipid synthase
MTDTSDHIYRDARDARRVAPVSAPKTSKPFGQSSDGSLRSKLVLLALGTVLRRYNCQIAVSRETVDCLVLRHPKFLVELDQRYAATLLRGLISTDPEMLVGEGYMHGRWRVVEGALEDVLTTLWTIATKQLILPMLRKAINRRRFDIWQRNTVEKSKKNIEHHYDAENANNSFFQHMLGEVPCYSAGVFVGEDTDLAKAQKNKINIIAAQLNISKGDQILDIGSGWGVLTRRLAAEGGRVTGITLSREQLRYCESMSLTGPESESYLLQDYRTFFAGNSTPFDIITCIEVLDHIGRSQFDSFFRLAHLNLKTDGQFFLQLIARPKRGQTSGWIDKYIYPGGYIASIEEIRTAYERAGFQSVNMVHLPGSHYAQTLRQWRNLLIQSWRAMSSSDPRFDEVFYRRWMFFLAYSISAFEHGGFCNYHLTLKKI